MVIYLQLVTRLFNRSNMISIGLIKRLIRALSSISFGAKCERKKDVGNKRIKNYIIEI